MEINIIIDNYLNLLDKRLNEDTNPWDLSVELEDFVSPEMYDFLKEANPTLLSLMADDIFDITESLEPGMDGKGFYKKLALFKDKFLTNL
ncbi:hypothetical protein [Vagococcus sp.]|uniref:hypothetical protein n=1 Tax=Vagococcus sp. TaxID=1933889 RepID=UPI003F95D46D